MQLLALGEALDRGDLGPFKPDGEQRAALHRLALDMHGAAATLRGVAADMCAGEAQILAQEIDKQCARIDVAADELAVH